METEIYRVEFKAHLAVEPMDSLIGQLAALGDVRSVGERRIELVVRRVGKLAWLQECLQQWEVHGFATWERLA